MVFLDANIILETILSNRAKAKIVEKIINQADQLAISALSVHLVFHFGLKDKIQRSILQGIVEQYEILNFSKQDYLWAKQNCADDDFEDALQVAIAVNNGCDSFVTLDKSLASNYKKHIKMILV